MRSVTFRQLAGAASGAVLTAAAVGAALLDRLALAVAALALLAALVLLGLLQVRRRLAEVAGHARALAAEQEAQQTRQRETLSAALAQARQEGDRRQQALLAAIGQLQESSEQQLRRFGKQVYHWGREQTREVEALLQLFRDVAPRAPMPSSGQWALNPTDLLQLWSTVQRSRPGLVLELGSGTSSVWLGYAVERHGGRLVSVEHDPAYAEQTRAQLRRHGLARHVEVRESPLQDITVDGDAYRWYDPAAFADLSGVDVLVVDGPPGATCRHARYPALPLLAPRLSSPAAVLLDDADRTQEQEILRGWMDAIPGLARESGTTGHLAVLTYASQS